MSATSTRTIPARFADSWASIHFDSLRAMAAFLVMFGHWRNILFVDYPQISSHRTLWSLPYLLAGVGHQAVIFFFVLSGYFIGGTVLRSLERNNWAWSGYLLRRFVRLWIVLVPALLLCLFWDKLGIHLGRAPMLYSGQSDNHIVSDVAQRLSPHIFLSNLFFLQTILTPTLGSDGPLWSLANEFWYYLLFPLGVIALWPRARWSHRLFCAVLFVAAAWFVRGGILLSFPIWLGGVLLFKMPAPSFSPRVAKFARIVATLIYLPIFFVIGKFHSLNGFTSDYVLGVITLAYLWILLSAREPYPQDTSFVLASREGARFSYTLYAAHLPFLIFAAAFLVGDSRWQPTPVKALIGLALTLGILLYAYCLAFLTEFRTDAVRIWLERILGLASAPPMLPSDPLHHTAKDVG